MTIERTAFGQSMQDKPAELIVLRNSRGTQVKITTVGASVVSFICKDKRGQFRDVILGYETPERYQNNTTCFGAIVGRSVNRIAGAKMNINEKEYLLEKNDGDNNLHTGSTGVQKKNWEIEEINEEENSVTFQCFSSDGESGFPGNMMVHVTYKLDEENSLSIGYMAVSDEDTIANFSNHMYFNLAGHESGSVFGQKLKIYANAYTPIRQSGLVPTGEICPVEGTPFDFREWKEIGKDAGLDAEQLGYAGGYDHNFVLDAPKEFALAAEALCEESGIHLYAYTDRPGVHLYAANYVENEAGKEGVIYMPHQGFCLETQYFPNAVNEINFETPLLEAGVTYTAKTTYRLGLD